MKIVNIGRPLPESTGDNPMFRGEVYMRALVAPPEAERVRVLEVTFRPGGRTVWHRHSVDQYLLVTNGHGFIATDEGRKEISTGDLVHIPARERHAHGALDDSEMTHIAIMEPSENELEDD
jgi:quercetin dioxygenase-like cupin family protein